MISSSTKHTEDVELLFLLSLDFNGSKKRVTYRPLEEFKEDWDRTKSIALKDYLIQNLMSEKGRAYIAKYHGFYEK